MNHGCCSSCGYVYCQILDSCIRPWLQECSSHRRLTKLADFSIDQLMLFIVGVLGALGALLLTLQKSKCQSCCWGCIKRDVAAVLADEKLKITGHTGLTDNENDLEINEEK